MFGLETLALVTDLHSAVVAIVSPAQAEERPRDVPAMPARAKVTFQTFVDTLTPVLAVEDDDEFAWRVEEEVAEQVTRLRFEPGDILPLVLAFSEARLPAAADTRLVGVYGLTAATRLRQGCVLAFQTIRAALVHMVRNPELLKSSQVFVDHANARSSDVPLAIAESNHIARAGLAALAVLLADFVRPEHMSRSRADYITDLSLRGTQHMARLVALATRDASLDVGKLGVFDVEEAYRRIAGRWAEIEAEQAPS